MASRFLCWMQIEFAEEADLLIFENEHSLGTKPKQIDVLIIKKYDNTPIQKTSDEYFGNTISLSTKVPQII
ncbi:MAG: hypothetical protein IJA07_01435 [Agathobacter sp.]|nr:hypothetical protein [Agathobacter sp.]